jgi:adenylate cyclase
MPDDVFISYARETEAEATRIAAALDDLGYEVWRDDQLAPDEEFGDVIQQRLEAARSVVVLWSRPAVKSAWVRSEASRARAAGKLVQVNLDGVALPMPFDQVGCAHLKGWRGEPDAPGWLQTLASLGELVIQERGGKPAPHPSPSPTDGDRPSLALMPFANLSGDPAQDYFVDGLMEEIATALTRIRTLFVIAASSSLALKGHNLTAMEAAEKLGVRYILEGSVRKAGGRVRIAVKMIDAVGGAQIWANRFEDDLADIFDLQDKVAAGVAGVVEFSIQHADTLRSLQRPTSDLKGYDAYLRAVHLFRTYRREDILQALELLDHAIELDPDYGLALSLAACCHALILRFGWTDDPATHRARFGERAARSAQAGSNDPQVLASTAQAYWAAGLPDQATPLAERAAALNPGSSLPLLAKGQIRVAIGDLDVAEDCILRSMRLDPLSPNRNLQLGAMTAVRFAQGRFAEAAEFAREWTQISSQPTAFGFLAAAYGRLGQEADARKAMMGLRALSPIDLREMAAVIYRKREHRALFVESVVPFDPAREK